MPPEIITRRTFAVWDEESIEIGETDDTGWDWMAKGFTFRELVEHLREYQHPSSMPASTFTEHTYVTTESDADLMTGDQTEYSLFFAGPPSLARYWVKALRLVFDRKEKSKISEVTDGLQTDLSA